MPDSLNIDDARRLMEVVTNAATRAGDLAERRRLVLLALGEIIDADAGHWAWGRGDPITSTIAPVAMIDFGYTPDQCTLMIEHALKPETTATFQHRVASQFDASKQATIVRRDMFTDAEWAASKHWSNYIQRLGLDSFLLSIRYHTDDTWSGFHFLRQVGCEEFGPREAAVIDLALTGIAWLTTQAEEFLPAETFVGLTTRQRTVMLLLLDGMSRKQIGTQLGVTEDTVGDHITGLYQRFAVKSAGELAAKFLKGR